jgi:hypothetical protein
MTCRGVLGLCQESRISPEELMAVGVLIENDGPHGMIPGEDGKLASLREPDDIFLVTAGGEGAGWSAYVPSWAPKIHSRASTRRVPTSNRARLRPGRHRAWMKDAMSTITVFRPVDDTEPPSTVSSRRRCAPRAPRDRDRRQPEAECTADPRDPRRRAQAAARRLRDLADAEEGRRQPDAPEMASGMAARAHLVIAGVGD